MYLVDRLAADKEVGGGVCCPRSSSSILVPKSFSKSVENRLVIFDSNEKHRAVSTTDTARRTTVSNIFASPKHFGRAGMKTTIPGNASLST